MSRLDELTEMTASYSEICDEGEEDDDPGDVLETTPEINKPFPIVEEPPLMGGGRRPDGLPLARGPVAGLDQLEGTLTRHGNMVSFVADGLEEKLRSPSTPSRSVIAPAGQLLSELEAHASQVAASVDSLIERLADSLHGMSAISADCLETYRDAVCKTCDTLDANIKAMYQLMAKCEELSKAMQPVHNLCAHIKNIKHLLDLLEASGV